MEKNKLCCMLLLCYGFLQIYLVEGKFSDPQILVNETEEILEMNGNYTYLCQGNQPLRWKYPEVKEKDFSWTTIRVEEAKPTSIHFKYEIRLHIYNMSFPFVGFYYCLHENAEETEESSKIYLYVDDPENLSVLTNEDITVVYGRQSEEVVIPCRPSSPLVNVELSTVDEKVDDAVFDSKTGFSLVISALEMQNIYCCNFSRAAESYISYFDLVVETGQKKSYIANPVMKDNENGHTTIGGPLNLSCSIQSDVQVDFQWRHNDDHRNNNYKIKNEIDKSTLVIEKTIPDDSGIYTCYVSDHQNHTSNASIYVRIFGETDNDLIMAEPNDQYYIQTYAGKESVTWVVHIWGHPEPNYKWKNNRNITIPIQSGSKYDLKFRNNASILTIKSVDVHDFGEYSLTGWNAYNNKTLYFFLNVTDKPSVTIQTKTFHTLGKSGKVNCTAAAYPQPTFEWFYKPCKRKDCIVKKLQGTLIEEMDMVTVSQVEIIATEPVGVLTCFAKNFNGSDEETIEYFVSDFEDGFVMTGFDKSVNFDESGQNATFAIGSTIRVTCAASVYKYENIEWLLNDSPLDNNNTYEITRSKTDYSYISYLEKESASYEDAGKYSCKAKLLKKSYNGNQLYEEKNRMFLMADPSAPVFAGSEMEETIERNYPQAAELICEVYGIPKPNITWYKEGLKFDPDKSRIHLKNDSQLLRFNQTGEEDEATYQCKAQNIKGWATKTWHLKITNKGGSPLWYAVVIIVLCIICAILIHFACVRMRREKRLQRELKLLGLANFEQGAVENINPDLGLDDQAELLPYDKKWEFPIEHLKLGKQLGSGAFGVVMKGEAKHIVEGEPVTTVAVKMVKKNADHIHIKALASELKIMVHLGQHLNVVNLLGACTKNVVKKELLVIVEYCRYGNLQNYLLRHRDNFVNQVDPENGKLNYNLGQEILDRTYSVSSNRSNIQSPLLKYAALTFSNKSSGPVMPLPSTMGDYRANQNSEEISDMTSTTQNSEVVLSNNSIQPEWRSNYKGDYRGNVKPISTKDLVAWSFQVARGMDYLSSRKVLHGDLAARNILLADENIVKICDFGLAKTMYKNDNYKKRTECPLPVKWMAIESIRDRMFSTQSDVWSFGIVLWELFSLARTPYPGMEADEKLYHKLLDGYRMDSPEYAPKEIYELMTDCWKSQPMERPSFSRSAERLGNLLEDSLRKYYVDLNDPYLVMNTKLIEDGKNDYLAMVSPPTFEALSSPHQVHDMSDDGYMSMNPGSIFSPRVTEGEVFDFNIPNRKPSQSEGTAGHELLPMLHPAGESETDTPLASPNLSPNPDGVSNPSYHLPPAMKMEQRAKNGEIVRSLDNYVNMPKNKDILRDKLVRLDEKKNEVEERNYVNGNVRDWESVAM